MKKSPFTTESQAALDALPSYQLKPCPKCGQEPVDVSFELDTGICARCSPCATTYLSNPPRRCMFPAGHGGDCVPSMRDVHSRAEAERILALRAPHD